MDNQFTTAVETATTKATHAGQQNLDRTVAGLKDGMAQATAGMEQAQEKLREGMDKAMKTAEEMFAFTQGNLEAFARSGQIFASGMQDLSQRMAATAKATMDETMSTMKAMGSVKSLKEAADLQQNLARATVEKMVAQSGQMVDSSIKLTEQTLAPISARMSLAAEKFSKVG